jgi:ADP-dependent NAD(P)H-hydrate dehydratase / NAD(P)H-hydrate epimerase
VLVVPNSEILTVAEHYEADRLAEAAGVSTNALMAAAGAAIAREIQQRWTPRKTVVLCGPGNNGGDGIVAAARLGEAGWDVIPVSFGDLDPAVLAGAELVVDAMFGAGLSRPLDGAAKAILGALDPTVPVVAVDVPSGLNGDTGAATGPVPNAALTVTFVRKKPGHMLYPGRGLCGEMVVADIGTPNGIVEQLAPQTFENGPDLWSGAYPWPQATDHKYRRGHALVVGGGHTQTGAARMAAMAAMRAGAGLVTMAGPTRSLALFAAESPAFITEAFKGGEELAKILKSRRRNAVLVGPANGVNAETRENAMAALGSGASCVIDADALAVFEDDPSELFAAITGACVLTPHDGEFARLLPAHAELPGRLDRARAAARGSGAVVVLKGPDTIIAAPNGRAAINGNGPATLATAGSGDVLAGFIVGLLAQGMDPFHGACAGVWLHGAAATTFGPGLIATDLAETLPRVLGSLKSDAD